MKKLHLTRINGSTEYSFKREQYLGTLEDINSIKTDHLGEPLPHEMEIFNKGYTNMSYEVLSSLITEEYLFKINEDDDPTLKWTEVSAFQD